ILVAVVAQFLRDQLDPVLPTAILLICLSSASVALYCSWRKIHSGLLAELFRVSWPWLVLRILGAVITILVFFEIGSEIIWGANTGQTMVGQLVPTVMTLFLGVIFLLPLMTEFGIMEFAGVLLSGFFRFLFRLPGRGAIDAMASWLGAAPLGALVTTQQYERGHYNRREALSIISSFSLASVAFCLLIASILEITHIFVQFYGSVAIVSILLAIIVCRLPPLSKIPDTYEKEVESSELVPAGESVWNWALRSAVRKAADAEPWPEQLRRSGIKLLDLWFGLIPTVIAIGTIALIIAEYTPVFSWISYPFRLYLDLLAVPEAAAAAPSMVVGFADMILPAVLGAGIESELTRFTIAGISVTQVIYMSEIGTLILRSKIETTVWQLAGIFLVRTVIAIPMFVALGRLFLS
ncbi:MAG: YjiH family protein, partial [Pseudomonadales bacterium]|nr:YjiH family protein [Pseudomonadales bacterium]